MRRRTYLISIIVCLASILTTKEATACRCARPSFEDALKYTDVVFAGTAKASTTQENVRSGIPIEFEVSRVWKGAVEPKIKIATIWTCEQVFEQGKEYLVFARHLTGIFPDGILGTTLCERTLLLADATEDLASLGLGKSLMATQATPSQKKSLWIFPVATAVTVLIILWVRAFMMRKRLVE
jgi:hypothetical protein